jgi:hypothetical protein
VAAARDARADLRLPHAGAHALRRLRRSADRARGDPYGALASPTDEKATYAAAKRGGTEDVTLEMIKNDDVGSIVRIPVKLSARGQAHAREVRVRLHPHEPEHLRRPRVLPRRAQQPLRRGALRGRARATIAWRCSSRRSSTAPIAWASRPSTCSIPFDLQETAVNLFNRSTNLDKTFIQDLVMTSSRSGTGPTPTTGHLADPADIPTIEIGFLDGREEPELFVQDNPTVGSLFTNDKITWKIRHIYGGNVTDFRGATKAVV